MAILIVTHSMDNEAPRAVTRALESRGERVYRFDTDLFPTELQLALDERGGGRLSGPSGVLELSEVSAVWYRRNSTGSRIPKELDPQLRKPSVEESRRLVFGMLAALGVFQLDSLETVRRAEHKPLQLALAHQLGLEVPRTLMTNDPEAVRAFAASCPGGVVTKMMSSFAVYDERGREQVVFTTPLGAKELEDLEGLDLCPMTFQERLTKQLELRVTVVGERVMAAAIDSQALPKAREDWRREGAALVEAWKPYTLPEPVRARVLGLMDALGLNYGAFDFIVTPEGRHVFLEVNPAGEFMWLMRHPGLPIDEALADVLTGRAARRLGPKPLAR
ncbi:MvdC/MvdD family ATP grasp protein [Vitiosangium sp. GDMCC 1.1324]|uniref:MvdC/MvdD family ATP grasp protein n=1 Tax=Vitiosangium sp. (strain GDMCC 1.1324) TaxID=2138576 RepID=UPI000D35A4A0|nr:MvdD family ATP-grasp ribosomal peptide maturase [Vitiosangium sp. GDMCC 1.1324]PTL79431.1 MvdD family ATP-grasp ribosomal peptide maturase [Vitiosangium sp. GDMCC 1.1324]